MSNKIPKEIWITPQWREVFECQISKQYASNTKLEEDQVKYLSEEHFNSLIEEKDKEIKRLQNIVNGACFICNKLKDKCTCTASINYLI